MEPASSLYFHKRPSLEPILSWMTPVHTLKPKLIKIHFNMILPCTTRSSRWVLTLRFSDKKIVYAFLISPRACLVPRVSRSPWFGLPNNIEWRAQIMNIHIIHFSHIFVFIFPQQFVLRHSQSVFFPRSKRPIFTLTQDNEIIVLYISITTGLGRWQEDRRFWTEC